MINPPEELIRDRVGYACNKKPGYKPEVAHNTFVIFNAHARNKLSMTANLKTPNGLDIFKRLIKVSDVFVETNSPRVKENLGITWEVLKEVNPKLIMLSLSGFGGTGPYKYCRALGNPEWTRDPKFAHHLSRLKHHDEMDKHIEQWTRQHNNHEVMHILQREGVPAGVVMDEPDAYADPHLRARGFFNQLTHDGCGTHLYPGLPFKMSNTPNSLRRPPVRLGEHNEYVYKEVIGVCDEEYQALKDKGHIGTDYVPQEA